jgi:hypothetical protein
VSLIGPFERGTCWELSQRVSCIISHSNAYTLVDAVGQVAMVAFGEKAAWLQRMTQQ